MSKTLCDSKNPMLAEDHWEYVRGVLAESLKTLEKIILTPEQYLELIEFHYVSAFLHGYKHGEVDAKLGGGVMRIKEEREKLWGKKCL